MRRTSVVGLQSGVEPQSAGDVERQTAQKCDSAVGQGCSNKRLLDSLGRLVLRKAFRDAVLVDQLLPSSPVERAKRPRKPIREPGEIWTARQLRVFLTAARGHRLFAFYHLAAYTGARRGELLNLRWHDVDLASAEINISGSTAVIGGTRIEGTTKSGRSRTVSIDAGTVEVLKEHRSLQAEERLLAGPGWRASDDYVFTTGWGAPVHPDTVSSLVADLIKAHNATVRESGSGEMLPRARLHDLRHLHATTLQVSRIASDASFGSLREHPLPAAQRAALRRALRAVRRAVPRDLGCQRLVASGARMGHLIWLRWVAA